MLHAVLRGFRRRWVFIAASLAAVVGATVAIGQSQMARRTWSDYGGAADSMQYSALKQINKTNVSTLQLAFFYPAPGPSGRFAFSPLIVDEVMFVVGKDSTINAIDAATAGIEISMNTMFGRWALIISSALRPSLASPKTSTPGIRSNSARIPARTTG